MIIFMAALALVALAPPRKFLRGRTGNIGTAYLEHIGRSLKIDWKIRINPARVIFEKITRDSRADLPPQLVPAAIRVSLAVSFLTYL